MKRKFAWLLLPLALGVVMLGVKWRAENPPATKWDLRVRSLISESSMKVVYSYRAKKTQRVKFVLSPEEKKAFIDSFHLSQKVANMSRVSVGGKGVLDILCRSDKPMKSGEGMCLSL